MRRLPVYLLLDISGSMRGEPISAVNMGVKNLVDTLKKDPYALETVFLSIITFNNQVEQLVALTELYKFVAPELTASLGTYIGKAIKFLSAKAEAEVVKTTQEVKGDWKPLVFIMSDGKSGDKIEKAIQQFNKNLFGNILICATGPTPNTDALRLISENVVQIKDLNQESINAFFQWVSASIEIGNKSIGATDDLELPPPPEEVNVIV